MYSMQSSTGFESESLQTDVMRFMAIIGFCLVAIFALVPNTDARATTPTVPTAPPTPTVPAVPTVPTVPTAPNPEPAVSKTAAAPPQPTIIEVHQSSPAAAPSPHHPLATAAAEPGLSLSFSSDRDFLRLVGAGTVELFVMDQTAAEPTLRFDPRHPQRSFTPAKAPGRIYELLPGTIPATIATALARQRALSGPSGPSGPSGFTTWGVKLPPALERDIAQQREQHSHGTLLIGRDARIRHVPPA